MRKGHDFLSAKAALGKEACFRSSGLHLYFHFKMFFNMGIHIIYASFLKERVIFLASRGAQKE